MPEAKKQINGKIGNIPFRFALCLGEKLRVSVVSSCLHISPPRHRGRTETQRKPKIWL